MSTRAERIDQLPQRCARTAKELLEFHKTCTVINNLEPALEQRTVSLQVDRHSQLGLRSESRGTTHAMHQVADVVTVIVSPQRPRRRRLQPEPLARPQSGDVSVAWLTDTGKAPVLTELNETRRVVRFVGHTSDDKHRPCTWARQAELCLAAGCMTGLNTAMR